MTAELKVSESWLDAPLRLLIGDAGLLSGVLLLPSGQVLAQFGFERPEEVMSICALASAINASSGELGRQLDGKPFQELHHSGGSRQLYMARCAAGARDFIFVSVFDRNSSLGVVNLYFEEFCRSLRSAQAPDAEPSVVTDLERDLNSSLDALFGPLN